jgi:transcription initiation factor TFIIH subunit 3
MSDALLTFAVTTLRRLDNGGHCQYATLPTIKAILSIYISFVTTKQQTNMTNATTKTPSSTTAAVTTAMAQSVTSLLVIVVDVSAFAWGERNMIRSAQDKKRAAEGKRTVGPAVLDEALDALLCFISAYGSLEADAGLILIGVADSQVAVLYPRKDALHSWMQHPETYTMDMQHVRVDVTTGIAELVRRAAAHAQQQQQQSTTSTTTLNTQGTMAAGVSRALCLINRVMVASHMGGVRGVIGVDPLAPQAAEDTVVALQGKHSQKRNAPKHSGWASRILCVQVSEDRSRDYNAFMNCAFAAVQQGIVMDGCFLPATAQKSSSAFLEQACDLSGGVFLAPSGAAQVGGALTEVLLSVFLAPLSCRSVMHLPALNKVDFRARCFTTGVTVDQAFVCNQCLSIFQHKPKHQCPTCQARIQGSDGLSSSSSSSNGHKRLREN